MRELNRVMTSQCPAVPVWKHADHTSRWSLGGQAKQGLPVASVGNFAWGVKNDDLWKANTWLFDFSYLLMTANLKIVLEL